MKNNIFKKIENLGEFLAKLNSSLVKIMILFFSVVGYMAGIFSLTLWSIELQGKVNPSLNLLTLIFGMLMWTLILIISFRVLLFLIKIILKKILDKE